MLHSTAIRLLRTVRLTTGVLVLSSAVFGIEPTDEPHPVIPPGQEELLADILGRGATFADGCTFAGGQADGPVIRATYTCPTGEVVLELVHPSLEAATATRTDRFAITLKNGSPPDGLIAALASRIRSREAAFEWKWIGQASSPFSRPMIELAAIALLGLAALGWALRMRRSARRTDLR
jgi:hypothetical protein